MTPYEIFKKYPGHRDYIFRQVLKRYQPNPINVFQIGGCQNWLPTFRVNSGWSDFFWAEYMKQYGGCLVLCDISEEALENSFVGFEEVMSSDCPGDRDKASLVTVQSTGEDFLAGAQDNVPFTIYYLDGSDCPNEMVKQFFLVPKNPGVTIICDDWKIKGTLLSVLADSFTDCKVDYHDVANGVAVFSY